MNLEFFVISLLNGVSYGLLLFMLSSGLTLIFSMMGVLNFAHTSFYMLGAYFAFTISSVVGFWPALVLAPLVVFALGAAFERYCLRRVHKFGHVPELLVTFGLSYLILELVQLVWGRSTVPYGLPEQLQGPLFTLYGTQFPKSRSFVMLVALLMLVSVWLLLTRTRIGLVIQAALKYPEMVEALGHNVPRVFMLVFGGGAALAGLYPLLIFATGLYFTPDFNWRLLWWIVVVMAGIPVYALIAISLGVFASDPHAQETQARVRPTYAYLYMMLSSLYIFGLYASSWLQTVAIMILTASLALALWQKARDELPYLLDPAAAPPARVALSDGLIAATLFFVLQLIVGLAQRKRAQASEPRPYMPKTPPAIVLASGFRAAAALLAVASVWYWMAWPYAINAVLMAAIFCALAS
eukprot:gene34101-42049_t